MIRSRRAVACFFVLIALVLIVKATPCFSQTATPAPSPAAAVSPAAPATQTSVYTLPPDKLAKSKALYDLRGTLRIIGTVWSFVVLIALLYLGVVARYRDWVTKISASGFVQGLMLIPLFVLTIDILDLPLAAYEQSISRQYGLSVQGWGSWFADVLKGEIVTLIVSLLLIGLLVWRIRRSPRWWWFQTWLVAVPFLFLFVMVTPYVIDPMFNKFEPLDKTNPELVTQIERVTSKGGLSIPRDRMFLMKASEKVTTLNAYVTGFGPSKRVVVWDTTIQKATTPETLFVFGHEMGHYVLNHVVIGLVAAAVGMFIGLFLLYRLSGWFLNKFGVRWHIRELGDWAALPMIFLIFGILGFIAQPITATVGRQIEHNADIYGLEVTHGINANPQESAAHAFQVLGELSLSYPHPSPLVVFWYYDHPSIPDRVRFAHQYDPWGKGEQPKYVK
ncbi:MAG TPA: M48 family metallopeptidase [Candidatus Angelobacter sp.]|nr:M48 family metallopeptidase [Candidatus Angelobacter sp.]